MRGPCRRCVTLVQSRHTGFRDVWCRKPYAAKLHHGATDTRAHQDEHSATKEPQHARAHTLAKRVLRTQRKHHAVQWTRGAKYEGPVLVRGAWVRRRAIRVKGSPSSTHGAHGGQCGRSGHRAQHDASVPRMCTSYEREPTLLTHVNAKRRRSGVQAPVAVAHQTFERTWRAHCLSAVFWTASFMAHRCLGGLPRANRWERATRDA